MGKPWSRAGAGGPVALAVLAAGLCAGAQDGVERWLAVAALAPAELGADLLIRAAGPGGPVKGNQGRTRLLSVAFELAGRAVEPYPKLGRGQDLGESRAAYVAYSAGAGVSRLAIQCRVVRGFLGVDPGAARLYLEKFRRPAVPQVSCGDLLVADVSEYYAMAGAVLGSVGEGEGAPAFLHGLAEEIHTPLQLAPMARLLADAKERPADLNQAVEAFAYRMRSIRGAEPAFRYALLENQLAVHVEVLGRKLGPDSRLSALLLLAFRDFLVGHLTGRACHESYFPESRRQIYTAALAPFNDRLRLPGVLRRDGLPALNYEELWPGDADNTPAVIQGFWREGLAARLWKELDGDHAEGMELGGVRLSPEEVAVEALRWQRPEDMTEEEYFHQKVLLWKRAALAMPAGEKRLESIQGIASFLGGNPMQVRAPAEWLWHVEALMREKALGVAMRGAFRQAGDQVLRAYAELEDGVATR